MTSLRQSSHYRWMVVSRVLAAVVGGYALASSAMVLLALLWPLPKAEAVAASTMLSFLLYALIIIWIFTVKRLKTVWLGLIFSTAVCSGLSWLLLSGAAQ
ncbi:hypothetical protein [Zhongshania aliphaticivorans]|uniref:hypothetical protein n=1 Tax=Zhongshania aliphaticivorans TaxID=1470434 RepID=UPI0012E49EA5|nr:hypothetical protein [Zhongshania aliphaticivorans]CAA0119571.1 Uncharacterised protein [Zhongshania aliphaticivorans]